MNKVNNYEDYLKFVVENIELTKSFDMWISAIGSHRYVALVKIGTRYEEYSGFVENESFCICGDILGDICRESVRMANDYLLEKGKIS